MPPKAVTPPLTDNEKFLLCCITNTGENGAVNFRAVLQVWNEYTGESVQVRQMKRKLEGLQGRYKREMDEGAAASQGTAVQNVKAKPKKKTKSESESKSTEEEEEEEEEEIPNDGGLDEDEA